MGIWKDKGIYDAMNKGIKMASGDIIGILNSDDFYTDEDVLQTVADNFLNHSVDAIYGDIHFVHEGNLGKCVRYYSSKMFSPFGFVLVSCPLIHLLLQERCIRQGWSLSFRLQDWFRLWDDGSSLQKA